MTTRRKTKATKPVVSSSDSGLATKIGKMLVRLMSRPAPEEQPRSGESHPPTPTAKPGRSPRKPDREAPANPDRDRAKAGGSRSAGPANRRDRPQPPARPKPKATATEAARTSAAVSPSPTFLIAERVTQPAEREELAAAPPAVADDAEAEDLGEPRDPPEEIPRAPRWSPTIRQFAAIIEQTLIEFGVPARVVHAETGPMILRFGVAPGYLQRAARADQPARRERVRAARIVARSNDLALALGVTSLRIEAPVPGKSYIGIEVPNPHPKSVPLPQLLDDPAFKAHAERGLLPVSLGRDVAGQPILADLARLPHLLIAGATGAGKSVAVNSLLGSILRTRAPSDVRIIVVDPKRVEFSWLQGVPHLLTPVVTDIEPAVEILGKAETEMAHRYDLLANAGCRNRVAYNASHQPGLPALVVVIDELADLMMLAADDVERSICRLAQLGRAAGIHLVVATQRPSVDVVTGLIKANLPARLAFATSSMVDSRTILDQPGAERLLGRGDFLFLPPDAMRPVRGQGAFARDSWLNQTVKLARASVPAGTRDPEAERFAKLLSATQMADDRIYQGARQLAQEHPKISASYLQRKLRIGYPKAEALIERLRADGVIADPDLDDE